MYLRIWDFDERFNLMLLALEKLETNKKPQSISHCTFSLSLSRHFCSAVFLQSDAILKQNWKYFEIT